MKVLFFFFLIMLIRESRADAMPRLGGSDEVGWPKDHFHFGLVGLAVS